MQRHQYAETGQQGDHGCASVANHRQWHSDHRQDAAHHSRIDEHVNEEAQRDRSAREPREGVLALVGEVQRAADHGAVQRENQQLAEQAEFFPDHGEDEVRGAFRQEFQLRLTAVHVALAEDSARADGDLGLNDVVAGAQRIVFGIEEHEHALALVLVNEMPAGPGRAADERYGYQDDLHLQTREQHHDQPGSGDQQGSAEIRLDHDHRRRNPDHDGHDQQILEGRRQRALVHVPRAHHRYRELHDFGRLEAHEPHIEPALRAFADMSRYRHDDQQQYPDHIRDRCEQTQILRGGQPGERQQRGDGDGGVRQMVLDHSDVLSRSAVHHQNADAQDDRQYAGQRAVQAQRAQRAAAYVQGAAGTGWREFVEYHTVLLEFTDRPRGS